MVQVDWLTGREGTGVKCKGSRFLKYTKRGKVTGHSGTADCFLLPLLPLLIKRNGSTGSSAPLSAYLDHNFWKLHLFMLENSMSGFLVVSIFWQ
jgi:hypothetical protein